MKIEVELHIDETNSNEWFTKITDVLAYATDRGFKEIKVKPEGYGTMEYGVTWNPKPLTNEEHQKLLKEWEQYKNSKR
jgi:hypothetical protein